MKKRVLMIILIVIVLLSGCAKEENLSYIEEVDQEFTMTYDGIERTYYVYIPSGVKEQSPMLMMLHGYGGSIDSFVESTALKDFAKRDHVVLVYPEGTPAIGLNHWNAKLRYEDIDDVGFLTSLTSQLSEQYKIDEENVYIAGHSNGGFMAYTLACETNDLFRAFMSVSGTMSGETWETCTTEEETNIFQFHGTEDLVVPIDGSMTNVFGWGGAPNIEEMLTMWTVLLDNPSETTVSLNENVTKTSYISSTGHIVVYIKAMNYGHMWAEDDDLFEDADAFSDVSYLLWEYMMSFLIEE